MIRNLYIVAEGGDGSGKSTLATLLVATLKQAAWPVQHMSFPSRASAVGGLIRDVFEGRAKVHPDAMMWLFVAEAKDREQQIRQWLIDGYWVICDRHPMVSGLVYQSETHGLPRVQAVTTAAGLRTPDRIYLVDVPGEVALTRRAQRGDARNVLYEPERLEQVEAQRAAYRKLYDQFATMKILDGTQATTDLVRQIWTDIGLDPA